GLTAPATSMNGPAILTELCRTYPSSHCSDICLPSAIVCRNGPGASSPVASILAGYNPGGHPFGSLNQTCASCADVNPAALFPKKICALPPPLSEPFQFSIINFAPASHGAALLSANRKTAASIGSRSVEIESAPTMCNAPTHCSRLRVSQIPLSRITVCADTIPPSCWKVPWLIAISPASSSPALSR